MNRKPIYVYVAGPYTNPDPVKNTSRIILVADELAVKGYTPYVPHLTMFWHLLCPHNIDFWYKYDLCWLDKCDCILRLSGESIGADMEVAYAKEHGKPVYYSTSELARYDRN